MIVVPAKRTPLTPELAGRGVIDAWGQVFGSAPDLETFALIMALAWIETAQGSSLMNFNFGNLSASNSYSGMAWRPPWFPEPTEATSERNRHLHAEMLANRAPSAFRAYDSPEAGAKDYVAILKRSFPEVVAAAGIGDVDGFRQALSQKYSHDYARNAEAVNRNLSSFQTQFRALGTGLDLSPKALSPATVPAPAGPSSGGCS